ncbi:MAG: mersacidin/lichenicidin family type 2 lantibiotic [Coleofasciculus sp. B1-GNL1-01]|uniref:mersacidin/lichenicidin family type 2 lantibiotic n=1 Tax=Coleofasciculus sp. B1-GNL1-01 TaxID=3068484 RepID=UPI0032FF83C2
MSNADIIRAWKDEDYRASLSDEEKELLPENPVEVIELTDEELSSVSGGCTLCGNPWHTL